MSPLDFLGPYKYLVLAGIAAVALMGAGYGGYHYRDLSAIAAIEKQNAEASKALLDLTEKHRKQEQADADKSREIDSVYQSMVNDAYAGRDDFAKRLRIARRTSCGGPGTAEAANPSISQEPAAVSESGLSADDIGLRIRDGALELQRYAVACHDWALSVGR